MLLAARKKKLLRSLRLLLKHLLLPPTQPLPRPLPTQPSLLRLLTLLLPLRLLLRPLLTQLLLLRPLLRKLLTLLQPSNQHGLIQNRPAGRFFFACTIGPSQPASQIRARLRADKVPKLRDGIKKPASQGRFFDQTRNRYYFSSSVSNFRIFAPVSPVSSLPSLVCTLTWLVEAPCSALTITR